MPIRHATLDDAEAVAALTSAAQPDGFSTPALVRHRWSTSPPEARSTTWLLEEDGRLLGWAAARLDTWSAIPGDAIAHVAVHPESRLAGVGTALWAEADAHLAAVGARRVLAEALDDPGGAEFARRRRFRVTSSTTLLALDPRTLPEPGPLPHGVDVIPFADLGDDLEQVYRVDLATAVDEPGDYDVTAMTYDAWRDTTVGSPVFAPRASNVVTVDGRPVGSTLVYADPTSGRALNGGTGVLREHRGHGLALLMKRHALAELARAGVRRVITQNDDANAAMLRINEKLGYRPFAVRHRLLRADGAETAPAS